MGDAMKRLVPAVLSLLLGACVAPTVVTQPTTAKPQPLPAMQSNNGAIFQSGSARYLFEEPVARNVGDTLVIVIEEKLSASNKSNTGTSRTSDVSMSGSGSMPYLSGALEKLLTGSISASGSNTSAGKGETSNSNTFTGTLAVTVVDVLPNGNLMIGGEKRVNVNGEINNLRMTGVVNPREIKAGNTISSTKVADARIEQVGEGVIADSLSMAWLARFFLSVLPL
ncbi:MAG: flagellar biosynthesis protein FlgH [Proteobacteria bacterium]|nr:flagellar biosynthesis protein FlgH [Pseudomonadota bacterium]